MNILSGQHTGKGVFAAMASRQLKEFLQIDHPVYRSTLSRLRQQGVVRFSGKYALSESARDLTLYDLIVCFHYGMPLGNAIESGYNKGDFRTNRQYKQLRELELKLEQELSEHFKKVKIFDWLHEEKPTRI